MTTQQHPAQFDWATELLDAQGHVTLSAKEAHEIGARLRSMGEKLNAYEDLDEAASDVQLLRMGYAAARLEIESLQARIKTMAEEHADELMVAHLDGRMRAAQPAGAQQPGDERAAFEQWSKVTNQGYDLARNVSGKLQTFESTETEHAWRGFFHGLRASHGQAPAQAAPAAVAWPRVTDAMALAFHSALSDGAIGSDEVEETKAGLRAALAAAPAQPAPQQEVQEPYSIDVDPQGIRALVADAITGALAFGAQGTNAPPDGHWLAPFWAAARAEREAAPVADLHPKTSALVQRFAALVAAKEREACAQVCDHYAHAKDYGGNTYIRSQDCKNAATAIRARCAP